MTQKGGVFKCTHCEVVCHKICIERAHDDLPLGDDEWTCWDCVRAQDSLVHTAGCDRCNEAGNILLDLNLGIDLLESVERSSGGGGGGGGAGGSGSDEESNSDNGRTLLASPPPGPPRHAAPLLASPRLASPQLSSLHLTS